MRWGILLVLLVGGCSSRSGPDGGASGGETSAEACSNGRDDDGDGLMDCQEPSCAVHAWCGMAGTDGGMTGSDTGTPGVDGMISACSDPLDIVFVIDVSTSMADEIERVRVGMDSIWAAASALTSNTRFGLVVFVDNVIAVGGCSSFASIGEFQAEFARWRDFTTTNNQPAGGNMNSDCAENSLDALHDAANECPWRDGATHIVIHVTDDTFAERPDVLSPPIFGPGGIPVERTYTETVAALVAAEVRVGTFAAPGPREFCGALEPSINVGPGFHEPYMAMDSIPTATGGRAWSIRDVRAGTLDMAEAIAEFAEDEYCTLF